MTNKEIDQAKVALDIWEHALSLDEILEIGKRELGMPEHSFTLVAVSMAGSVFEKYQLLVLKNSELNIRPRNDTVICATVAKSDATQGSPTILPRPPILIFLSNESKPTIVLRGRITNTASGPLLAWFIKSKWQRFHLATSQWEEVTGEAV